MKCICYYISTYLKLNSQNVYPYQDITASDTSCRKDKYIYKSKFRYMIESIFVTLYKQH